VNLRYKALHAGLEGVAWFCEECGQEIHRVEFDTDNSIPQDEYWKGCEAFNADAEHQRCPGCGAEHAPVDLSGIRWLEVAEAIRASG
jgi:rubrerythrin